MFRYEEGRGRYLVAAADIRVGEIVARESPIVAFPVSHEWKVAMHLPSNNINLFKIFFRVTVTTASVP